MKKSKRMISLFLALIMVFCFMAVSASAATTEVQPRGTCPNCTYGYMETVYGTHLRTETGRWSTGCPGIGAGHQHYNYVYDRIYTLCRNCGYTVELTPIRGYCPYNGFLS